MERYLDTKAGAVEQVVQMCTGAKIRVRLSGDGLNERYPSGYVLDADGTVIGDANSYTYGGAAFAVHTPAFAGYAPFSQCEFV